MNAAFVMIIMVAGIIYGMWNLILNERIRYDVFLISAIMMLWMILAAIYTPKTNILNYPVIYDSANDVMYAVSDRTGFDRIIDVRKIFSTEVGKDDIVEEYDRVGYSFGIRFPHLGWGYRLIKGKIPENNNVTMSSEEFSKYSLQCYKLGMAHGKVSDVSDIDEKKFLDSMEQGLLRNIKEEK